MSDYTQEVERLVRVFSGPLASQFLYTEEDLRQEIHLAWVMCQSKFDPNKGTMENFFRNTVRNRIRAITFNWDRANYKLHQSIETIPKNTTIPIKEDILDYIPWYTITPVEAGILRDYLDGRTFDEIAERWGLSKDAAKHRFDEILIKLREANE